MIARLKPILAGDGIKARAIRGTALSVIGFGGSQFIRLASNLILTRLLFPEAFGLMALVMVLLIGLDNFSDLGIGPAIIQNKNGDKAKFLNTAWSVQIIRGLILAFAAWVFAVPIADFYGQPELQAVIPIMAMTTILTGLSSTRIFLANRNLTLGRLTFLELASQTVGTIVMIGAALWLRSVWALVIGTLAISMIRTVLSHILLPGPPNRLQWDKEAFGEIFHFGKYIFFGTIAGYFIQQGDRMVLGKYVALDQLAIFTIAQMFATLPLMMSYHLVDRVLLPLFRNRPPAESEKNRQSVGRARGLIILSLLGLTTLFALSGELLISFLYDERYHAAGAWLILLSISTIPRVISGGYGFVLIANGNSRDYTILTSVTAILRMIALIWGVQQFGILGAVIAAFAVDVLIYPFQVFYVRRYHGWYAMHDLGLFLLGILIGAIALWNSPSTLDVLLNAWG